VIYFGVEGCLSLVKYCTIALFSFFFFLFFAFFYRMELSAIDLGAHFLEFFFLPMVSIYPHTQPWIE